MQYNLPAESSRDESVECDPDGSNSENCETNNGSTSQNQDECDPDGSNSENCETNNGSTSQSQQVSTKLELHAIPNNPGEPIKLGGRLTGDNKGIEGKTITFETSGTVKLNPGDVKTTSDGAFTVEGEAPDGGGVKALFRDDDPSSMYEGSTSDPVTYPLEPTPTTKIATKLELHKISKLGESITLGGTLTNADSQEGVDNKTITFDTSGTVVLNNVKTTSDGTFSVEGAAPAGQRVSLYVTARFDGDLEYQASNSQPLSYLPEGNRPTVLELDPISYVNLGGTIDVHGTLTSGEDGQRVSGRIIRLIEPKVESSVPDTTVPENVIKLIDPKAQNSGVESPIRPPLLNRIPGPASQSSDSEHKVGEYTATTENDGRFTFTGIGKHDKEALWQVQAHFDGDTEYGPTSDAEIYSSTKDIIVIETPDVVYEQSADEKEVGIKLPIPDPKELPEGCVLLTIDEDHDDALNEIDITGTTLNFDSRDKTKSKIIEYSVFYDCQDKIPTPTPDPDEDPTPPAAPVINSPVAGTIKTEISQISGNAEAETKVNVFNGGTLLNPTATAGIDGKWSVTLGSSLGDGTYSFTAKATDAVGNTGPASSAVEVVVDTTGPAAPFITNPTAGTQNTGISGIDGTAEPGSKVEVSNGGTLLNPTATAGNDGKWSVTFIDSLGPGTYSFTAKATDAVGNAGPASSAVEVVVDTTGPTVTASPTAGSFGVDQSVILSSPDADIDKIYYTTDGSEPDNTDAEFTDNISVSAATGATTTTTIKFIGYDTLGNAGPVGSETYIVDKLGPTVTAKRSCEPCGSDDILRIILSSNDPDIDTRAIYYTTDGSNPSSSSGTKYEAPIPLSEIPETYVNQGQGGGYEIHKTINFIGYDKLGNDGPVGEETYIGYAPG